MSGKRHQLAADKECSANGVYDQFTKHNKNMAAADNDSTDSYDEILTKQRNSRKKAKINSTIDELNAQHSPKVKYKTTPDAGSFIIPEIICQCMQKCTERVTAPLIQRICIHFKGITDRNQQYKYLSKLIQIRETNHAITDKKLLTKGKLKASFRYFVPILSEADYKTAVEKRSDNHKKSEVQQIKENKCDDEIGERVRTNGIIEKEIEIVESDKDDWDHIEVCLKAFINVHVISDKRVILTRATQKLQTSVKCSRPFSGPGFTGTSAVTNGFKQNKLSLPTTQKRHREEVPHRSENKTRMKVDSGAEISRLAGEWLFKQAMQSKRESSKNLNPRSLLPEGLVLPSSVTCMPIFTNRESEQCSPTQPYLEENHDRDLNIVSDFFSDQLWKLENIGGAP